MHEHQGRGAMTVFKVLQPYSFGLDKMGLYHVLSFSGTVEQSWNLQISTRPC
jgi:hypothetical protein